MWWYVICDDNVICDEKAWTIHFSWRHLLFFNLEIGEDLDKKSQRSFCIFQIVQIWHNFILSHWQNLCFKICILLNCKNFVTFSVKIFTSIQVQKRQLSMPYLCLINNAYFMPNLLKTWTIHFRWQQLFFYLEIYKDLDKKIQPSFGIVHHSYDTNLRQLHFVPLTCQKSVFYCRLHWGISPFKEILPYMVVPRVTLLDLEG